MSAEPPRPSPGRRMAIVAVTLLGAVVLVLGGFVLATGLGTEAEVVREPVATAGANPFMPSVGVDTPVATVAHAGGTVRADTPGLYGGTGDAAACDRAQLSRFLADHPDRAAGWAGVLGVAPGDIDRYVDSLTPVLLRSDTLVTNHGWRDGAVTSYPAVLQAGSAVLVDTYGNPVTRCFCGNPLTAPSSFTSAVYVGPTWSSFSSTSITVVATSTTVVNDYTIVDVQTGRSHDRPQGTEGGDDRPAADVTSPLDPLDPVDDGVTDPSPVGATPEPTEDDPVAGTTTTEPPVGSGSGAGTTTTGPSTDPGSMSETTWLASTSCPGLDGLAGQLITLGPGEAFSVAGSPSGTYTVSGGTLVLTAEDAVTAPPTTFTGSGDTLTADGGCTLTRQP